MTKELRERSKDAMDFLVGKYGVPVEAAANFVRCMTALRKDPLDMAERFVEVCDDMEPLETPQETPAVYVVRKGRDLT